MAEDAVSRIARLLMENQRAPTVFMNGPTNDPMFDRLQSDLAAGMVSPLAHAEYPGGVVGPMNITPFPIPLKR